MTPTVRQEKDWEDFFDDKASHYDKDGGFIVYVEGYDNKDFDVELIKEFIRREKDRSYNEGIEDERGRIAEHIKFGDIVGATQNFVPNES